ANIFLLQGVGAMPEEQKAIAYLRVYEYALVIPVISVLGVILASWLRRRAIARLMAEGRDRRECEAMVDVHGERPAVNWWILGGGLAFAVVSLSVGLGNVPFAEEIVFAVSMAIVLFMMWRLTGELEPTARNLLVGTAVIIFVFRGMPGPGVGQS